MLIIPCFNDNQFVNILINNILAEYDLDVLVIDDGSFAPIELDFSDKSITLLKNRLNKGKGYSLKKGFEWAYDHSYSHAITLDADLQHDPEYIKNFMLIDENVDIVIGMRDFNQNMPIMRRFSNKTTSFITSRITGKKILDSQSGYRRYKLNPDIFNYCIEHGFQFETEILINTLKNIDSKLEHVSISTVYNDEKSSINNTLDTYKFIKMILRKILKG